MSDLIVDARRQVIDRRALADAIAAPARPGPRSSPRSPPSSAMRSPPGAPKLPRG